MGWGLCCTCTIAWLFLVSIPTGTGLVHFQLLRLHTNQKQLSEQRAYFSLKIIANHPEKPRQDPEVETTGKHCFYWLIHPAFLPNQGPPTQGEALLTVSWALQRQSSVKKMPHRCGQNQSDGSSSSGEVPSSKVTRVSVKLAKAESSTATVFERALQKACMQVSALYSYLSTSLYHSMYF